MRIPCKGEKGLYRIMINRLSDMVVFDENGSEWVASEVLEPISEACESVQKDQIKLKEKLKKMGVNSKDAALIEKECRDHEQKKIDRIQEEIDVLMCLLPSLIEGNFVSAESLKMVLSEKQIQIIEMNLGIKL